ncbi:hypothetical protein V2G26_002563 [Clonostachys chloroleuca]
MPGTLSSTSCMPCKVQKRKCDQTWPVCKACERKNIQCPGPSSLLKFVYGGPRADHKSSRVEPFYQGTVSASDVDAPAGIKEKRKAVFTGRGSSRRVHGYQSAFRLAPRPVPTSQAERIGSQLVDHLQSRPITDMVLMGFLPDLPRYLPRSKTLQDSVSLLCLLWTNCRRGIPAVLSVDMPEYGKAIGSLRRTLERSKKMTLQTLASAAILGRLEYSFLPSSGLMRFGVHPRGISIMTQQLGPPGRDDVVYAAILRETYKVLIPYWFFTGDNVFLNEKQWKQPIQKNILQKIGSSSLEPHEFAAMEVAARHFGGMYDQLCECHRIRSEPHQPAAIEDSHGAIKYARDLEEAAAAANTDLLRAAIQSGDVEEVADQNSLPKTSYKMSNIHLGEILLLSLRVQFLNLRIYYDWAVLYDLPQADELYSRLRDLAVESWKYISFLRGIEFFDATMLSPALWPSLELATEAERQYLMDFFTEIDNFRHTTPKDKKEEEMRILSYTAIITGRKSAKNDPNS